MTRRASAGFWVRISCASPRPCGARRRRCPVSALLGRRRNLAGIEKRRAEICRCRRPRNDAGIGGRIWVDIALIEIEARSAAVLQSYLTDNLVGAAVRPIHMNGLDHAEADTRVEIETVSLLR